MRKRLVRRTDVDRSQQLRLAFQLGFLALNVWIGVQFYAWVRFVETSGATRAASRPPGIEGWLPIAGLMNLKAFVTTGQVPRVHAAGMFLLIAFLAMSLLLKKAFCSWLCPIGTISEWLWRLTRMTPHPPLRGTLRLLLPFAPLRVGVAQGRLFSPLRGAKDVGAKALAPRQRGEGGSDRDAERSEAEGEGPGERLRWLDISLRSLKYLLFGFFAWAIARMSAGEIAEFMQSPYGLIADVKLLNFFRFIGTTGLVVIGVIVLLSVVIQNFWCRYLCPYGALLGLTALLSPSRIRRDADACIDCAKCAKVCPSRLPVDKLPQVFSAECTLCMQCTAVCPAAGALDVKITRRRRIPAWGVAASIGVIFFLVVGTARLTGHWRIHVPFEVYKTLVSNATNVSHPMPR